MNVCVCVCVLGMTDQVLINDARWQNFYFTSSAAIKQLLELLLREIRARRGKEKEDMW
jgi:hypothetical protein